jgi:DNA processing protein
MQYYVLGRVVLVRRLTVEQFLGRPLSMAERVNTPRLLYCSGVMETPVRAVKVAVVGTREPTDIRRALDVAEAVVSAGGVVVGGLARGVDTIAHRTAVEKGGGTIAVLGTPLGHFYPPENRELQRLIMRDHLAVSQFPPGSRISPKNFLIRNRTIALLSNMAVIVEAEERSGVIPLGWECIRLGRPLLIHKSLTGLSWTRQMLSYRKMGTFTTGEDVAEAVDAVVEA